MTHVRRAGLLVCLLVSVAALAPSAARAASPWAVVASPNVGAAGSELSGVAAVSATNVWAVGVHGSQPLIEHWNGSIWAAVSSPTIPGDGGQLSSVYATNGTDITAIGTVTADVVTPLVEHYNGTSWSVVTVPLPVGMDLTHLSGTSPTNVWATATSGPNSYLLRWNGSNWQRKFKYHEVLEEAFFFTAVNAIGPKNVWAAASDLFPDGGNNMSVHWSGGVKGTLDYMFGNPDDLEGAAYTVNALGGSALSNVFAVGSGNWFSNQYLIDIEGAVAGRYDGSAWTDEMPPLYGDGSQHWFNAVSVASPSLAWAVGNRVPASSSNTLNLLDVWNGSSWTEYGGPNPTMTNELRGVAAVPGSTTDFWAVGWTGTGVHKTMVLHCCS